MIPCFQPIHPHRKWSLQLIPVVIVWMVLGVYVREAWAQSPFSGTTSRPSHSFNTANRKPQPTSRPVSSTVDRAESPSPPPSDRQTTPSRMTTDDEWKPPVHPQEYTHYTRRTSSTSILIRLLYWLLYSLWFWVILAILVVPSISVWLSRRQRMQRFLRARMAELANPIDAGARFQLGHMLLKQRRYKRALGYLREAHRIQTEQGCLDPRLLDALADTLLALGERDKAISLYKQSLSMDATGGQGDVFVQLGRAYQEKKELQTAESWLMKACEANRSLAEPVYRLALHLHHQNKKDQARQLVDEFLVDAHALPNFIRRRNRRWVWLMRIFPLGQWFA